MDYKGEFYKSPKKMYKETIFFVHFYGGSKKSIKRHIKWVNDEGFDAFAFELEEFNILNVPISSYLDLGLKHRYADQIESLLNEIDGDKIIFSFSNPTAGAIEALSRRHCQDIKGLICDSGPSAKLVSSVYNLYSVEKKYSLPRTVVMTALMSLYWDRKLHTNLQEELAMFPKDFPILSVRGWKDTLIPPDHIDAVFEPQHHLDWRKLALLDAEHLNGLRDYPKEYKLGVKNFLDFISTPLEKSKQLHSHKKTIRSRNQTASK